MILRSTLAGALAGFTTRGPGVPPFSGNIAYHVGDDPENVAANRARLEAEVGELAWMSQVHGTDIREASGPPGQADALLVRPGQGAAVMVADCVPLLLASPTLGAVVHVGRRGLFGGIVPAVLDAFAAEGVGREEIEALIGPSVCGRCYEVPQTMAEEAEARVPGSRSVTRWGTPGIDIPAGIIAQLGDIEVRTVGICTVEDDRFFSYRRSPVTGRFAGVLALRHTEADHGDVGGGRLP